VRQTHAAFFCGRTTRDEPVAASGVAYYPIDYIDILQLRGESAPLNDTHFHPTEPRSFGVSRNSQFPRVANTGSR
jgi:hypothetical protein